MSGTAGRSGRRPTPTVIKVADGTFRADRDGDPNLIPVASGAPVRPPFENEDAAWLWDTSVQELTAMGVAKEIDTAMLRSMCELWGLYRASYRVAEVEPTDKDARISVTSYWAKFEQAAARFGLNASDRGRLRIDKPKSGGIAARKRG